LKKQIDSEGGPHATRHWKSNFNQEIKPARLVAPRECERMPVWQSGLAALGPIKCVRELSPSRRAGHEWPIYPNLYARLTSLGDVRRIAKRRIAQGPAPLLSERRQDRFSAGPREAIKKLNCVPVGHAGYEVADNSPALVGLFQLLVHCATIIGH
jgi:hypothetical protein